MSKPTTVAEKIGQNRPFRSTGQEAVIALWRTSDVLRRFAAAVVEPHGITLQQYNVLRILRGSEPDGLPTLSIAGRMIERAPGITRMIDRLETKGLVMRERRSADRRCVHCRVTPRGLSLLERLDTAVDTADAEAMRGLADDEQRQLIRLLDAVRAGHS